MKKICFLIVGLVFFSFMGTCFSQGNDIVTITTYYPSPYGIYSRMLIAPEPSDSLSSIGTACLASETGLMKYDPDDSQVLYCNGATWRPLGSNWTLSGTQLYSNNTNWNIGIGTTSPSERLTVLAPNNEAFLGLSGASAAVTSMAIGRTSQEARLGIAAFGGAFAGGAVAGDAVLRVDDSNRKLHLLTGAGATVLTVTSSNVGIGNTSPQVRLHVGNAGVGDARIEGEVDIGLKEVIQPQNCVAGPNDINVSCPAGTYPVAGGCDCDTVGNQDIQVRESYAIQTGWHCDCYKSSGNFTANAIAYCARLKINTASLPAN